MRGDVMDETKLSILNPKDLVEMIPGGYYIYRADMTEEIIHINKAAIKMYGCDTMEEFVELTGNTFPGMVHPDDIDAVEDVIWQQVKANEEKYDHVEYRIIRKNGEIHTISDYGKLVDTENYGPVFCVFIFDKDMF